MRKPHQKLKTGCLQCRRRRIKCPEQKPICAQCKRHSLTCTYDSVPKPAAKTSIAALKSSSPEELSLGSNLALNSASKALDVNLLDLELLHFYSNATFQSFAARRCQVWKQQVPQMAFASKYLMHGLLATTALHLSITQPARSQELLQAAATHEAIALPYYRQATAQIDLSNSETIFIFAAFVVAYASGLPSSSAAEIPPRWFLLLRSSLALLSDLYPTLSDPLTTPHRHTPSPSGEHEFVSHWVPSAAFTPPHISTDPELYLMAESSIPDDHHLVTLRHLISAQFPSSPDSPEDIAAYSQTLYRLRWSGLLMTGHKRPDNRLCCQAAAYVWPRFVPEHFITLLKKKKPKSLVLLAYFCVQLHRAEFSWYFRGQARRMLESIRKELNSIGADWVKWIEGPIQAVLGEDEEAGSKSCSSGPHGHKERQCTDFLMFYAPDWQRAHPLPPLENLDEAPKYETGNVFLDMDWTKEGLEDPILSV